ncbi:MAG: arsenate reductase (glutaredoxin) [Gammaproteobacteria bacterium HGW-Gammaproteobacteria-8]|nr:MAG: arsenate reductase (glutaredoxin) [Gammaproteobacteria bacterium HGW-Gammaproteobacteria-8]
MSAIIYHNPRCSKSRATLELLRSHGVEPEIVLYLDDPPSAETLAELAGKMGLDAPALLRAGEPAWAALGLEASATAPETLFRIMAEHPVLIQRPIVVIGGRARIGRPPEAVLDLLDSSR